MAKEALNIEEFEEEDFDEVSSEEEIDADVDVEDVPDGGIGDFVMSDEDLDAVYGEDDEDLDDERVASLPAIAARMAEYGRNEDDTLAHVATGELVIPAQFLKDDVIKQRIYDILSEAGVDNPEAYVVGAEENDLNPDTGLPEFFLKKIFKGIGKAIKGVVKVVKKALPVVLPIALSMFTPLGPIFGAALGSGIGTLVNGGSIGDALKSGLMSGAAGGIFAGFSGAGSFTENVRGAFGDVGGRFSQFGDSIRAGNFGGGDYVSSVPVTPEQAANQAVNSASTITPGNDMLSNQVLETATPVPSLKPTTIPPQGEGILQKTVVGGQTGSSNAVTNAFNRAKDFFFPQMPSESALVDAYNAHLDKLGLTGQGTEKGFAIFKGTQGPSLLRKYGPLAGAGLATMAVAGGFDTPDGEISPLSGIRLNPDGTPMSARDIMAADPERYRLYTGRNVDPNTGFYINPAKGQSAPSMIQDAYAKAIEQQPYLAKPAYVSPEFNPVGPTPTREEMEAFTARQQYGRGMADGGHVFPRRNGGISPDEGIAGKDSVKAMLMPGEFVMTTKAVRGLGNGDLNNGIKNMYSVMRNLEKRGRAA